MNRASVNIVAGILAVASIMTAPVPARAHGGEEHGTGAAPSAAADTPAGGQPAAGQPAAVPAPDAAALSAINNRYLRDVKQIFKRTCFDCHSEQTRYPAYYVIPGIKQFIDYDIREARKHIDMNADFPFKGHGTPLKDLKAIKKEVEEGEMPPFYYTIPHWKERLKDDEKEMILRWAEEGIKLLPPEPPGTSGAK